MSALDELEGMSHEEVSEIAGIYFLSLDYENYAAQALMVPPEEGGALVPFVFNRPQRTVHQIIKHLKKKSACCACGF